LILLFALIFSGAASGYAQTASPSGDVNSAATPERLSASFAEVAKKVEPAVVNIDTKGKVPEVASRAQGKPTDSDDIMEFFRRQLPRRPSYSVGSGFIVDKSGYIMTNAHVVEDAAKITVKLDSGEEFPATVVGSDEFTDLAVLKIDAGKDLPTVNLGDSDKARVGEWVLAIGSPFGLARTVTAGIISQTNRQTPYATAFQKFIQTDAAINRGNSGGPLVNMNGEVIGINSQIATSTGDYNGVGFALPSSEARNVYEQIVSYGKVRRGYLGISLESVKPEFASVYGLKESNGVIITDVREQNGAAATAGLKAGDVIVEFNGQPVKDASDLIEKVSNTPPEQSIQLGYYRENGTGLDRKVAAVRVGERPAPKTDKEEADTTARAPLTRTADDNKPFGLTLTDMTATTAATYKLEGQKGVLVKEINPESFVADVKLSSGVDALGEGDVIQRINRTPVTSVKSFGEIVSKLKKGDAVVLHVLTYNARERTPELKIVQFTVQ
jgi:serine protease Do